MRKEKKIMMIYRGVIFLSFAFIIFTIISVY